MPDPAHVSAFFKAFRMAEELHPDSHELHYIMGAHWYGLYKYDKAYKLFMKAMLAQRRNTGKTSAKLLGTALWIRRHTCNWSTYDDDLDTIVRLIIVSGQRTTAKYRSILTDGDPRTKQHWLYLDRFEEQLDAFDKFTSTADYDKWHGESPPPLYGDDFLLAFEDDHDENTLESKLTPAVHPFFVAQYDVDLLLDRANTRLQAMHELFAVMRAEAFPGMRVHEHDWRALKAAEAERPPVQRLRIGFLSTEFSAMPTSYLTADMFHLFDKEKYEVFVCRYCKLSTHTHTHTHTHTL